ncbi:MAG: hypothetical protein IKQ05_02950 [Prevotella sp.]|nr:hypothetical protein [Prevotella sp.]
MKKNYFYLLTTLLVAMMSFGLTACGDDDDDDSGSGGGNAAAVVDGKSYGLNHAWWDVYRDGKYKHLYLEFSNVDIYKMSMPKGGVQLLTLNFGNYQYTDVQPGTYQAEMSFVEGEYGEYVSGTIQTCLRGKNVEVNVVKDGDNFTVIIPETTVNVLEDEESKKVIGTAPFSFKYIGKLAVSPDDE